MCLQLFSRCNNMKSNKAKSQKYSYRSWNKNDIKDWQVSKRKTKWFRNANNFIKSTKSSSRKERLPHKISMSICQMFNWTTSLDTKKLIVTQKRWNLATTISRCTLHLLMRFRQWCREIPLKITFLLLAKIATKDHQVSLNRVGSKANDYWWRDIVELTLQR